MADRLSSSILILGGTGDARALAQAAQGRFRTVTSLAGRTASPLLPPGEIRIGGFGGPDGLAAWLRRHETAAVIDATHPYAARMGWNAAAACATTGTPLLRLERAPWQRQPGDRWDEVEEWNDATTLLEGNARRVLLALGRQELEPFTRLEEIWFLIRSVEAPTALPSFAQADFIEARGPFSREDEHALLQRNGIDTIVCKNSGGTAAQAKLEAARELGLRVVMKHRPPRPSLPVALTQEDAVAWLERTVG